jgi:chemotaxis protein MotA
MNYTSILGFGVAACILWFGVFRTATQPGLFLDPHALLLVLGGTLAAALIAYPVGRLVDLGRMFIYGFLFKRLSDNEAIVRELVVSAITARISPAALAYRKSSHPFLSEGYQLIAEGKVPADHLREILNQRSRYFRRSYMADAKLLTALAKFPPAFGLLGASTGMIAMMINLGTGGQETIGPAMAIALVATFWGIALANFVLLPLADYATRTANDDTSTRQIIVEGLVMLKEGVPPELLSERLNSFLPVHRRVKEVLVAKDRDEAVAAAAAAAAAARTRMPPPLPPGPPPLPDDDEDRGNRAA